MTDPELEYIDCDLCKTGDSPELLVKGGSRLVKCNGCGLIYINPRPKQGSLKEKYAGDYSLGYIAKEASKRRRAKKIVRNIAKFKKGGKFLDIGCSAGFILEAARDKGFEPYGVEISPCALKYAREELGLDVFGGYVEDAHFPDKTFDVITIYSVLEHVPRPTQFLREIERILKDDGLVEIWTPDIGHSKARRMGADWPHIFSDHIWYFTLDTIGKVLNKAGLEIYKNQFTLKDGFKVYARKKGTAPFFP